MEISGVFETRMLYIEVNYICVSSQRRLSVSVITILIKRKHVFFSVDNGAGRVRKKSATQNDDGGGQRKEKGRRCEPGTTRCKYKPHT